MRQFQSAAFCHLFEVVPNAACATVVSITEAGGLPLFLALDEQQLYKLSFDEFELDGDDVPITICEVTRVDPKTGIFKMDAQYDAGPLPLTSRVTAWTFSFGDGFNLTFQTRVNPGAIVEEGEAFARTLAEAMGWPGVDDSQ